MRWQGGRQSANVEDRRGARGPIVVGGGIGTLVILVIVMLLGGNPQALLEQMQQPGGQPGAAQPGAAQPGEVPANDEQAQFVSAVLAQTEDVWAEQFRAQLGKEYQQPILVLFSGEVRSACGRADAAVGPFYCPGDTKVYLDLSFFQQLEQQLGAKGDFARAYVIAHEVGHHIQNQLGTSDHVQNQRDRVSEAEYNDLSVRLELQADFLAGAWAHHADRRYQILEPGDIEEALTAAAAIGDDKLQMEARGYVVPDSFTHGTSEQRVRWFTKGLKTGDLDQGDTFSAREL
ncbi:MAG: neutral zinc metallopeptidase [Pirellulaceae bacterium]